MEILKLPVLLVVPLLGSCNFTNRGTTAVTPMITPLDDGVIISVKWGFSDNSEIYKSAIETCKDKKILNDFLNCVHHCGIYWR